MAAFPTLGGAAFSYFDENGSFFGGAGIGLVQTFTYDRKSFLGESLDFLIGKLELSYKRIFPIIGESLAEERSGLRRGGLFGVFIAEYAMKPPFF